MHHLVGRAGFVVDVFFAKFDREVVDDLGLLENREGAITADGIHIISITVIEFITIIGGGLEVFGEVEEESHN